MVEIHDGVVGPKLFLDFLTGYDLAPALNQHLQDLEWLFPEKVLAAIFGSNRGQFTRMEVKFKRSEPDATWAVIPGHFV